MSANLNVQIKTRRELHTKDKHSVAERIYVGEIDKLRPETTAFLKPSHWLDPTMKKFY
ncbi:hypothetical protein [Segnochrobactrum spirostomi]|uniref:hypothetical protein n=1 Tax=Segnochrobactrum spirostomi TaxID=2608987 RepID=UPI00129802BB|nr:hypothetical protein [Segnochrobactrum spirostomi]